MFSSKSFWWWKFVLVHQPLNIYSWPTSCNNCYSRTFNFQINIKIRREVSHLLQQIVLPPKQVLPLRYGFIYNITFSVAQNIKQYKVTIKSFFTYICMNFITMLISSLGGRRKWGHYKHIYYILQHVIYYG